MIDSDMWKQFLCSKVYGITTTGLCKAVADLTKNLCVEEINPDCLQEFIAGRLVPLDKGVTKEGKPEVRPVAKFYVVSQENYSWLSLKLT